VNTVMKVRVPYTAGNFLNVCETMSFSRSAPHGVGQLSPSFTEQRGDYANR
jgi:hypothetical protein